MLSDNSASLSVFAMAFETTHENPALNTKAQHTDGQAIIEQFHRLWDEFHSEEHPNPNWLRDWQRRLPSEINCGCDRWLAEYLQTNPPRFADWHRWTWEVHNAVNLKLDKPLLGYLDAISELARGTNEPDGFVHLMQPVILESIPEPKRSRAVITLAPDAKSLAELAITGDRMRAYAANHDCDFVVVKKISKQRSIVGNKYAYAEVASRYEQSLWLDTDVVVDPTAPSIFDEVAVDGWGMVDDLVSMRDTSWFAQEWRTMQLAWGVPLVPVRKAWNSGVVVAPRDALRFYFPTPMRVPDVWCAEQHWHTQCLLTSSAQVIDLPITWNNGYPWRAWLDKLPTSWFNHVNGCRPQSLRLALLQHLADGNTTIPDELVAKGGDAWQPAWSL